jgi:ABC-type dipeptide/oligopeptide/nickel transport system permease subunit
MSSYDAELLEGAPPDPEIEVSLSAAAPTEVAARSPLALFWRRFRADRVAMVSAGFILLLIVMAILAPEVIKLLGIPGPNALDPNALDAFGSPSGPSSAHIFGVDQLGRDVLSRVIYGSRVSLEVGIFSTVIAAGIGTVLGLLAGYYRGWTDTIISRFTDVMLAYPVLVLGLGIGAACEVRGCLKIGGHTLINPGLSTVIFIVVISDFTYLVRIVRGQVLSLREKEFVEASRSLGASSSRILFREILPNLLAPIIVYSSLLIPLNILFEAALSFLGVGIRPPTASWGQMISDAAPNFNTEWWYMVFPGVALLLTVLAFNLLGDGLLDALNPRGNKR